MTAEEGNVTSIPLALACRAWDWDDLRRCVSSTSICLTSSSTSGSSREDGRVCLDDGKVSAAVVTLTVLEEGLEVKGADPEVAGGLGRGALLGPGSGGSAMALDALFASCGGRFGGTPLTITRPPICSSPFTLKREIPSDPRAYIYQSDNSPSRFFFPAFEPP